MHIPCAESHTLQIEPFASAHAAALEPQADYDVNTWLYVPHRYAEYRYILGTRGSRPLICIGINPSTAAPNALDNTLKSVERIAHAGGFDSFIMFNVYAQRATRPDDMDRRCNEMLHRENMAAFDYILAHGGAHPAVWAAWGNLVEKRPYLKDCLRDMMEIGASHDAQWFTSGPISKRGHPHHPLYLKKDSPLDPFDIADYLDNVL
ncbi:MAG: DUF1643 domain-containing protein [Clostridia bacterium]|nr:DUF1643 domain-containing protein [Clostridia bacterium]MBR3553550.1 DUF1643 domain-containing protein [Clostridia bacterium]